MIGLALRAAGPAALLLVQVLFVSACSPGGAKLVSVPPFAKLPPSGVVPVPGAWLDYLNFYRAAARLSPVTENIVLSDGDRKHAVYIVKNGALQHGEHPLNAYYTPEGQRAAQQSNLFYSTNVADTDWWAIDTWMQSPFHAVGVLDPQLIQVGYGSHREARGGHHTAAALNVIAGLNLKARTAYPVFWPGAGTTIPISLHWGGEPSPLASCRGYRAPSGLPVIVQIGSGERTPVVSATSFTQDGRPLEHCVFDETTYKNPNRTLQDLGRSILAMRDAIVLIPRFPLTTGATYTASVTADRRTYTWSFTVSGAAQAPGSRFFSGLPRPAR